jgi:hypothetical protein
LKWLADYQKFTINTPVLSYGCRQAYTLIVGSVLSRLDGGLNLPVSFKNRLIVGLFQRLSELAK